MSNNSKRPDMKDFFRGRIDYHVNGMLAILGHLPREVKRVTGDVTDAIITVEMNDGTVWYWSGGQYASRKVNGCYAPLMPKPFVP